MCPAVPLIGVKQAWFTDKRRSCLECPGPGAERTWRIVVGEDRAQPKVAIRPERHLSVCGTLIDQCMLRTSLSLHARQAMRDDAELQDLNWRPIGWDRTGRRSA